jgi:hypothetical protein
MARGIAGRLGLSFSFDVKKTFAALWLTDQMLADQPMWRVPFYVIAQRMQAEAEFSHVIDHAWWLIAASGEPWGFVTEPYIKPKDAQHLATALARRHADWGVDIRVLSQQESAWYPGSTVPIVTTAGVGCLREFLRFGVAAALELL